MRYRSRAVRQKDQDIHEALLSGLTPQQVAADFDLAVEAVRAADRRVTCERETLGPVEAMRQRQLAILSAIIQCSLRAFQQAAREGEETTKVTAAFSRSARVAQRVTRRKAPDVGCLKVVLMAMETQRKLLGLVPRTGGHAPSESRASEESPVNAALLALAKSKGFADVSEYHQARMQHPRYGEYVRLGEEINDVRGPLLESPPLRIAPSPPSRNGSGDYPPNPATSR
jgi:hypothetical protein